MLALTRKAGQSIIIGEQIEITIVEVKGDQVRIGIRAPREISVYRKEIYDDIQAENRAAARSAALTDVDELLGKVLKKENK